MIGVSHRQSSLSPPPSVSCGCSAMPAKWTSAVLRRVPLPRAHSDNSPAGQRDPLSQMSTGAGQDQRRLTRAAGRKIGRASCREECRARGAREQEKKKKKEKQRQTTEEKRNEEKGRKRR